MKGTGKILFVGAADILYGIILLPTDHFLSQEG